MRVFCDKKSKSTQVRWKEIISDDNFSPNTTTLLQQHFFTDRRNLVKTSSNGTGTTGGKGFVYYGGRRSTAGLDSLLMAMNINPIKCSSNESTIANGHLLSFHSSDKYC